MGGPGNKVYRLHQEVQENAWSRGVADELVSKGFLQEISEQHQVSSADITHIVNTTGAPESEEPTDNTADNLPDENTGSAVDTAELTKDTSADSTDSSNEETQPTAGKKSYEDIKLGELKDYLTVNNIPFDPLAGKKALYALYNPEKA